MNWTVWTLALVGCVSLAIRGTRAKPGLRSFVFGFLPCSFLCVCPGFYFRTHYFIVMLPAVAMLAGVGGCELCRLANRWKWTVATSPAGEGPGRRKRHHSKPEKRAEKPAGPAGAVGCAGCPAGAGSLGLADLDVARIFLRLAASAWLAGWSITEIPSSNAR